MLEDLLQEIGEEGAEVCLAESPRTVGDELTALRDEYAQRYERAVCAIRELRGAPQFAGCLGDPGYPKGIACDYLSCWSNELGVIYVGLCQREQVLSLLGGARPHPAERQAITLLPPPV
jgi:hypothetical protein